MKILCYDNLCLKDKQSTLFITLYDLSVLNMFALHTVWIENVAYMIMTFHNALKHNIEIFNVWEHCETLSMNVVFTDNIFMSYL